MHGRARLAVLVAAVVLGGTVAGCADGDSLSAAEGTGGIAIGGGPPGSGQTSRAGPVAVLADRPRAGAGVVAAAGEQARYNYAPSIMVEGTSSRFRMWWCSQLQSAQPPGDDVVYAESASLAGPFGAPNATSGMAVFGGVGKGFDARHTCDPSVIKVDGIYYLYYTGAPTDHGSGNAIGLALSADGVTWARANNGNPILTPANQVARANHYGAGQPSVLFLDGWFYLLFTDTTAAGAGANGAGQFVVRSRDPSFTSGLEVAGQRGFAPADGGRARSVLDAFSADWMWVAPLNTFAIAHETSRGTTITFWNANFTLNPYQPVLLPGPWQDGPGLARTPEGHAPLSAENPCDRVPIDLVRATRDPLQPTDLMHFGLDLTEVGGCADGPSAVALLRGFAVPSPQRTVDIVIGTEVVRVERRSVAEALGFRVLGTRPKGLDAVPVAAQVPSRTRVVTARDRGVGFLLDDGRLLPVSTVAVAAANSSAVTTVSQEQWDSYRRGVTVAP